MSDMPTDITEETIAAAVALVCQAAAALVMLLDGNAGSAAACLLALDERGGNDTLKPALALVGAMFE